ncbi:MAG TPA: hypothetical protein VH442_13645 [Micromonosporaceae bacterium]
MARRDTLTRGRSGRPVQRAAPSFPRRDAAGHIAPFSDLAVAVVLFVAMVTVLLVIVDAIAAGVGRGSFGHIPGWPAGILAVWTFIEDFRAWRIGPARAGVALVSAALGALGGTLLASVLGSLPPLWQGALGALLACLIYAVVWFYGIRLIANRISER